MVHGSRLRIPAGTACDRRTAAGLGESARWVPRDSRGRSGRSVAASPVLLSLLEERAEELRVSSSVREAREAELPPRIDAPASIAVVDDFYWRAVRPGEIRVKLRVPP